MSYLKKKIDSYQFSSQSKPDLKAGTMSRRSYRSALGNALNSQVKEEKKVCAFVFFDMLGRYRRLLLLQSTSKTYKTDITAPGNSRQMLLLTSIQSGPSFVHPNNIINTTPRFHPTCYVFFRQKMSRTEILCCRKNQWRRYKRKREWRRNSLPPTIGYVASSPSPI